MGYIFGFIVIVILCVNHQTLGTPDSIGFLKEALDSYKNTCYDENILNILKSLEFAATFSKEFTDKVLALLDLNKQLPTQYREYFINLITSIKVNNTLDAFQEATGNAPTRGTILKEFAEQKETLTKILENLPEPKPIPPKPVITFGLVCTTAVSITLVSLTVLSFLIY